jgi:hypothetical protein
VGENIDYTGPWTALALGPKLEPGAGQRPASRVEGDRVFLRGLVKVKSPAEELALEAGDLVCTLPAGSRPPTACTGLCPDVRVLLAIAASGAVTVNSASAATEGTEHPLDGISFNLSE